MFAFSGAIHFLFFCFFVRFTMNWTFLATWLWWRRRWRWITMTIYSTELFQALSRLLRRRLSCFWFIFYYVSAMFIKRDTVIINKTTFTVMWFFSRVCVCVSEERERERESMHAWKRTIAFQRVLSMLLCQFLFTVKSFIQDRHQRETSYWNHILVANKSISV